MRNRATAAFLALLAMSLVTAILLSGCTAKPPAEQTGQAASGGSQDSSSAADEPLAQGEDALYTPTYQPTGNEVAVIKTSQGVIKVKLYGKDAPIHVGNFVELAKKGFYDKTKFHRYEPGFVVQGGDPQTKDLTPEQVVTAAQTQNPPLGTGGPGYVIKGEFDPAVNPNKHVQGALGMARAASPDSAGSQFYFALKPLPMLDANYTVFGVITEGEDVMAKLRIGDEIESVTVENAAQ